MAKEIRNFCILSHVDHGKTTLSDHLISLGGLLPDHLAGNLRALDFLPAEQSRGITIDTSIATFSYAIENKKVEVYLLDTPGHVDFGLKTREAMTLVDNGLIIVDAVEGVMSQTRSVLRDALAVGLNLVLYINKVDRLVKEMGMGIEQIRARIELIIGEIGYLCQTFGYLGEVPS
ncbi:MAG: GTP-binding protein, partial [Candidatus Kariarchaeaceae archaeon]